MPLTPAEKQKKYREKLKNENPEKYEKMMKEAAERSLRYYKKKTMNLSEEQKEERRRNWKKGREKAKKESLPPRKDSNIETNEENTLKIKEEINEFEFVEADFNIETRNSDFVDSVPKHPNKEASPPTSEQLSSCSESSTSQSKTTVRTKQKTKDRGTYFENMEKSDNKKLDEIDAFALYVSLSLRKLNARNIISAQDEIHATLTRYKFKNLQDREKSNEPET